VQLAEARNAKAHSVASSSCLELRLAFGSVILDKLRADPFCLPPGAPCRWPTQCATLDATHSAAVEAPLGTGVVSFGVDGDRAAWKIAGIVGVNDVYRASARRRCHIRLQRRRWLG
jgi:hypothetical protein